MFFKATVMRSFASTASALALVGAMLALCATMPCLAGAGEGDIAGERVVDLPLLGGDRQRVFFVTPARPRGVIVMLPGGTGDVGISRNGDFRHRENFVVRTRNLWVEKGYAVVIPDTVDRLNLRPLRASPAYGQIVDRLVAAAFRLTGRPVVLLGTSQGTIAATNGAGQAAGRSPLAALVLTETVSLPGRRSTETVFDAGPGRVSVPTLVVANERDGCDVAPPSAAERVAAAFDRAPVANVVKVDGGRSESDNPCGSLTPHGYAGIEAVVVDDIARWLATLPGLRG